MSFRPAPPVRRACPEPVAERRGTGRVLACLPGIEVLEIHCCEDRTGFVGPGCSTAYGLVLTRSGAFMRRVFGRDECIDATAGYLVRPGDEHHMAHPAGTGDVSTEFTLAPEVYADWFGLAVPAGRLDISGRADLWHRAFVAACRGGADAFELTERIHVLVGALPAEPRGHSGTGQVRRPATERAHRRLVAEVRAALAGGHLTVGLDELARLTGCSPHHLSRIFRHQTGRTLTWYRNQLRVRAVLEDLLAGAPSLRTLAADHGFADQAHLTRVVRQHLGEPPSRLRPLLWPGRPEN